MRQAQFKDSIQVPSKSSAVLMTVISLDSALQKGPLWNDFLDLVERSYAENKIEKLMIVTTGYLQRHYFGLVSKNPLTRSEIENQAFQLDQTWLERQGQRFNSLKIPIEVIDWKELIDRSGSFTEFYSLVKKEYKTNKEFKNLVNKHSEGYVRRKILSHCTEKQPIDQNAFSQVAIDYVLEECAALKPLFEQNADLLVYPHGKPPPANYIWNKYLKEASIRYVRYETRSLESHPINSSGSFFKLRPINLTLSYLSGYVDAALRHQNWTLRQQCQFLRLVNQSIHQINSELPQKETSTKFSRRSI